MVISTGRPFVDEEAPIANSTGYDERMTELVVLPRKTTGEWETSVLSVGVNEAVVFTLWYPVEEGHQFKLYRVTNSMGTRSRRESCTPCKTEAKLSIILGIVPACFGVHPCGQQVIYSMPGKFIARYETEDGELVEVADQLITMDRYPLSAVVHLISQCGGTR